MAKIIGALSTLTGLYLLYHAYGDAQRTDFSTTKKIFEIIAGLLLGVIGYVVYKYASASPKTDATELEILNHVSEQDKKFIK